MTTALKSPMMLSAGALSWESSTPPTEVSIPASAGRSASDPQVLAAPIAVMDQLVGLGPCPLAGGLVQDIENGERSARQWFQRARTVLIEVGTRQPTILRAKTSMTKAT